LIKVTRRCRRKAESKDGEKILKGKESIETITREKTSEDIKKKENEMKCEEM
jgi:hypothetical protein